MAGGGISFADVLVLAVVGHWWQEVHQWWGIWAIVLVGVLLVLPFAVAGWLASRCTAWNGVSEGRCAKIRRQPFQRCELATHSHSAQLVTAPEIAAVVSFIVGLLGLVLFFG